MSPSADSSANASNGDPVRAPSTDTYIPTPNADGTCDPHIKDAGEGWYWVVCEDCSTELVEGEANALDKLDECDGTSES